MRTPGPIDPSLRLVDPGAGRGESLKAGASVFVTVREQLGPGLYRVAIGPRLLTASSASLLETGSVLKARVERSGDGILLRLDSPGSRNARAESLARPGASAALSAAGLPDDAAARAALAALLREGAPPEARALARVRRAAIRDGGSGGEGSDFAAKMEAKGMPAEDSALAEMLSSLGGRGGGAEGGGDSRRGRDGSGEESGRGDRHGTGAGPAPSGAGALGEDFLAQVPETELPRFLAGLFRGMAMRVGGKGDTLSLFNHLRGREGSWVVVPFRVDLDAVEFAGSFRIQLPYVRGGQGRFEAVFSASRGSSPEDWSFFLNFGGGRAPSLRIVPPSGSASAPRARSRLGALSNRLAPHSCSVRLDARGGPPGAGVGGLDLDA
jgi:hypothetical protein